MNIQMKPMVSIIKMLPKRSQGDQPGQMSPMCCDKFDTLKHPQIDNHVGSLE